MYCVVRKHQPGQEEKRFSVSTAGKRKLTAVSYQDIEAIVAEVPMREFVGEEARRRLADEQWLQRNALTHAQVVEEVMRSSPPVIPFKLGAIFRSRSRLKGMLQEHYARFQELFRRLQGKQEWGVKVFCHAPRLARQLKKTDQELVRLAGTLKGKSAGRKYFLHMRFEALLNARIAEAQQAGVRDLMEARAPWYEERVDNEVLPKALTGRKEDMILNAACLVGEDDGEKVRRCLKEWNGVYQKEGFIAECTGPWPPYNFAAL